MPKEDLYAFGVEYKEIHYDGLWDWFIRVSDLSHHWKNEPTYVISQFAFLFGGLATFIHAICRKGRFPYLWLGVLLHGLVVECMSYWVPDIDNFWHSQTPIMLLGNRLPLHIVMLCKNFNKFFKDLNLNMKYILDPCFLYQASVAVGKAKLPKWSEPFAVGLCVVLIDIPYDIMSVNYLHWTWHDTDPNIYDRHYWVPWNSYYFHTCFAASFTFWFHFLRRKICKTSKWEADSCSKELLCTVLASLLGTPGGIMLFLPLYHPLHDIFKIHSEVTYFILFVTALLLIWTGDRTVRAKEAITKHVFHPINLILLLHLVIHYVSFWSMPVFFNAEDEIAIGLKEPIGPCSEKVPVQTAAGLVLEKRKYLCPTDYDEKYFDWSCLPNKKPPSDGSIWYTACGVPLPNRMEYISIISIICVTALVVFTNLHFKSYGDEAFNTKSIKVTSSKKKK